MFQQLARKSSLFSRTRGCKWFHNAAGVIATERYPGTSLHPYSSSILPTHRLPNLAHDHPPLLFHIDRHSLPERVHDDGQLLRGEIAGVPDLIDVVCEFVGDGVKVEGFEIRFRFDGLNKHLLKRKELAFLGVKGIHKWSCNKGYRNTVEIDAEVLGEWDWGLVDSAEQAEIDGSLEI